MEPTTFTVRSADRTRIACHVSGTGPCVLLIPGATMDAGSWGPVRGILERRATVYAIDRRGTGGSGAAPTPAGGPAGGGGVGGPPPARQPGARGGETPRARAPPPPLRAHPP